MRTFGGTNRALLSVLGVESAVHGARLNNIAPSISARGATSMSSAVKTHDPRGGFGADDGFVDDFRVGLAAELQESVIEDICRHR